MVVVVPVNILIAFSSSKRMYYCTGNGCLDGICWDDDEQYYSDGEDDCYVKATTAPTTNTGSFDFNTYLSSLTGESWWIDDLPGGNANHTVRATRVASSEGNGLKADTDGQVDPVGERLFGNRSVVLKHAPPFFYKSPEMKFDSYRQVRGVVLSLHVWFLMVVDDQTVEARALSALHDPASPLYRVRQAMGHDVSVPVLIAHSPSQNVLIESDLGDLPTVDKFLLSPLTTLEQATRAGDLLARYLVELHRAVCFTSEDPSGASSQLEQSLSNSYIEPTMVGVIDQTKNYMMRAGVPDYEVLGRRAREHWINRKKSVFGQGDIWYGTVLVDVSGDGHLKIGVCDWELAGPNHPAGDIAQFGQFTPNLKNNRRDLCVCVWADAGTISGAYLQLSASSPLVNDRQRFAVYAFSDAFYSSYFRNLDSIMDDLEEFRRSIVIFHAWELINAAVWRQYLWCDCTSSGADICTHSRDMVGIGARMLRSADEQEVDCKELESLRWSQYFHLIGEKW
jgi:thiamine kinase-like enzyme